MFCPSGGLLGVSGTGITGTTLQFAPGHWLLDVQDQFGLQLPPLISESVRGIWQQQCSSWLYGVCLVSAKAEQEDNTSFRKNIFYLKNLMIWAGFTTGMSQAVLLV